MEFMPYIFNQFSPAAVSFVVYPVVEGTHQQEAKSAGKSVMLLVHNRLMMGICRLHISEKAIRDMPIISKVCTTFRRLSLPAFIIFPAKAPSITVAPKVRLLQIQV